MCLGTSNTIPLSYCGGILAGSLLVEFMVAVVTMVITNAVLVTHRRNKRCLPRLNYTHVTNVATIHVSFFMKPRSPIRDEVNSKSHDDIPMTLCDAYNEVGGQNCTEVRVAESDPKTL